MNFLAKFLAVTIFLIPLVTFAQSTTQVDRQSFLSLSDSFAYELGKTYQMGRNCDKELSSIGPSKMAGLFIKYMNKHEVQQTMNHYESGSVNKSGALCEQEELKAFGPLLNKRMTHYINIAKPFMRHLPSGKAQ